jgi:hypothetical protein
VEDGPSNAEADSSRESCFRGKSAVEVSDSSEHASFPIRDMDPETIQALDSDWHQALTAGRIDGWVSPFYQHGAESRQSRFDGRRESGRPPTDNQDLSCRVHG